MRYDQDADTFRVYDEVATQRLGFLQKVYTTFLLSLIVSAGGAYVGLQPNLLKIVANNMLGFFILELVALFATLGLRKSPGINVIALFGFTFISGLTLAPLMAAYMMMGQGDAIKEALVLTVVIFSGLTVYVFVTKKDFSFLRGFLFMGIFGLIGMGVMFLFWAPSRDMYLVYCGFGALLFCGYILYDTSLLLHNWESDDYIGFAISLYLDFLNLFLYLLQLLAGRSRD